MNRTRRKHPSLTTFPVARQLRWRATGKVGALVRFSTSTLILVNPLERKPLLEMILSGSFEQSIQFACFVPENP